jgi:ATP-dependent exoDNAse (exonuclease V) beta subunit
LLVANDRPLAPDGEPTELDELVVTVQAARRAPFWPAVERARSSGRLLVEAPFAVRLEAQEYAQLARAIGAGAPNLLESAARQAQDEAAERDAGDEQEDGNGMDAATGQRTPAEIVEGVIDLAIRTDTGWTIIDYKSDAAGAAGPAQRRARYRAQVALYAAAWERITGEAVTRRIVFYTADGATDEW